MKLLIADDHTLFRDALVQYIERAEPDTNISLAKDLYEVMDLLAQDHAYDLVLLDLKMPGMNGTEGFRKVGESYPDLRLALMSGIAEQHHVQSALQLGAVGFFPKTLSGKALLKAIQLVLAGEKYIPIDHENNNIMPAYYDDKERQPLSPYTGFQEEQETLGQGSSQLTPRENDVLKHLITGASNKEIANELGLQVVTVKLHIRGICRKLGAKNRTQAALTARDMGLIS